MAFVPLESALEIVPVAKLRDVTGDAQVLTEMRLVVDAEGQVVVVVVATGRALGHLALFACLGIRASFTLLGAAILGATAKHLALLVEGLAGGEGLDEMLLLGHVLELLRRCTDLGSGRI